jgi:hypothetical protein
MGSDQQALSKNKSMSFVPGPGQYNNSNMDTFKGAKGQGKGIGKEERFKTIKEGAPGPGNYEYYQV